MHSTASQSPTRETIRILGMSTNLGEMPRTDLSTTEVWPSNSHRGYLKRIPRIIEEGEWTRWFNLHSRKHMWATYPSSVLWHLAQDGSKPFYTQRFQPDIPGSVEFPRHVIQEYFATSKGPNRFFTCSIGWLLAFAILLNPKRIELWGFALKDSKPNEAYLFERPCFGFWVAEARRRGIEVWYQKEIEDLYSTHDIIPGDPDIYDGPLYGFETKPEIT